MGYCTRAATLQNGKRALQPRLTQHFPGLKSVNTPSGHFNCLLNVPLGVRRSEIVDCIWWQISPHVRSRVSDDMRQDPALLLNALGATARPFRFRKLPVELRLRVYRLVLASSPSCVTLALLKRDLGSSPTSYSYSSAHDPEPPLLAINRQTRAEALLVLYQGKSIDLMFSRRIGTTRVLNNAKNDSPLWTSPTNAERVHAFNEWASRLVPDSTRLLRKLSVQLPLLAICRNPGDDMLRFSLDLVDGKLVLNVEKHAWLSPSSQTILSDHTATISTLARSLQMEGEALIMVLTSRPDIWDQLELVDW